MASINFKKFEFDVLSYPHKGDANATIADNNSLPNENEVAKESTPHILIFVKASFGLSFNI